MIRAMRKKGWMALLAVMTLTLVCAAAQAEALECGVTYRSATVNLRQQPTQNSTRLGSYAEGSWMVITGESGNWYYVTAPDGKTGYMSKNYVAVQEPVEALVGVVTNPNANSFLNLRQAPSYNAKVLDIYYNGVPCVLLSQSGGWYSVRVDGVEGYFRQEYITTRSWPYSEEVATIVTPNNTGLNLRTGPGMGYPSMGQYPGGRYVMVLQKGNGWWKVSVEGQVGYMSTEFLKDGVIAPNSGSSSGSSNAGSGTGAVSGGYAVVTNPRATQVLNMRESPSTTSRVLGQYGNGTRVSVIKPGTEWCKVMNSQNVVGYMMTRYLTVYNLPGTPTMTVSHPQKTFVNLRSAPDMNTGKVLARMPHGAEVTVVAPGDGWVKVQYNGITGYAVSYFLK
ncbi:MAG: SH3 domain-containing protein [Aristaeellaceae bacterium]